MSTAMERVFIEQLELDGTFDMLGEKARVHAEILREAARIRHLVTIKYHNTSNDPRLKEGRDGLVRSFQPMGLRRAASTRYVYLTGLNQDFAEGNRVRQYRLDSIEAVEITVDTFDAGTWEVEFDVTVVLT